MRCDAKYTHKMLAILFVLIVCFSGWAVASDEKIYIDESKVGNISIGMDVSSLIKQYPKRFKKTVVDREGEQSPAFIYTFNNGKSITIEVRKDTNVIWFISVEDSYFKTREGIGVSNTFKEVKRAYPNAAFYAGLAEGEYIMLQKRGFAFVFDVAGIKHDWWTQEHKDIKAIENIKVNMVNIVN